MKAIRKIEYIRSGSVTIDLPADFQARKVEIIVLPIDEQDGERQNLSDLLLDAPTLTKDEVQACKRVRKMLAT